MSQCGICEAALPEHDYVDAEAYRHRFPEYSQDTPVLVCGLCWDLLEHGNPSTELVSFVRESNWVEGIKRDPTLREVLAHARFLRLARVTVYDLEQLVQELQPGAVLRRRPGCNVTVGKFHPQEGGPRVEQNLAQLLTATALTPVERHWEYETLHPFTDGNGRSGRALWLHHRGGHAPLGFLHHWYYETLSGLRPGWESGRR